MVKRARGSLLLSIKFDRNSHQPISTQLYVAMRELILAGGFLAGERLPATRILAKDLGISRTTVIEVFDRLTSESLVTSKTGAGTYVSKALSADRPKPVAQHTAQQDQRAPQLSKLMGQAFLRFSDRKRLPHAPRAFTTALPAFDFFPMAQWARLSAKYMRGSREDVMGYGDPNGAAQLRRAIAFHLIGSTLVNPGENVWFENPGAIGARNSLIACGANLIPVPVDSEGLRVDDALRMCPEFRLAFVTPSHQQPMGCVMSLERRFALLSAAEKAKAWIIEDDYDGEFFFGSHPPPTLKSVDTAGQVIYVGTFSKSLFPALRLGYLLAPDSLVDTFQTIMCNYLQGVPSHTQSMVAEFIDEGHFSSHVRRMRLIYEERHEALIKVAQQKLSGLLEVETTRSGLHTIANLPRHLSEIEISRAAEQLNVTASPLGRFALAPLKTQGLVLGFGGVNPQQIQAGVEVLASVIENHHKLKNS